MNIFSDSRSPASEELHGGPFVDAFLSSSAKVMNDFIFLRDDCFQIGRHVFGMNAPPGSVPRIMSHLGPLNHHLRGRASRVDARAADVGFFDQRDSPSKIGKPKRQRIARLTGADDNCIEFHEKTLPFHCAGR
jgi:hypothetical protein